MVIQKQTVDQIVEGILEYEIGNKLQIISPVIRGKKGEHKKELERIRKAGFVRVRIDGEIMDVDDEIKTIKEFQA